MPGWFTMDFQGTPLLYHVLVSSQCATVQSVSSNGPNASSVWKMNPLLQEVLLWEWASMLQNMSLGCCPGGPPRLMSGQRIFVSIVLKLWTKAFIDVTGRLIIRLRFNSKFMVCIYYMKLNEWYYFKLKAMLMKSGRITCFPSLSQLDINPVYLHCLHKRMNTTFPPATKPLPTIHGVGSVLNLSATPAVTCDASYFGAENVSFTWSINGKALAVGEVEKDQYADNSAYFRTILGYKLTRLDDQMNLTCSVFVENGVLGNYEKETSSIVNLYCKYSW